MWTTSNLAGTCVRNGQLVGPFLSDLAHVKDNAEAVNHFREEFLASPTFTITYWATLHLLGSPWFTRAWIVQDYVLGAKTCDLFQYGEHIIPQDSIEALGEFFGNTAVDKMVYLGQVGVADITNLFDRGSVHRNLIRQWLLIQVQQAVCCSTSLASSSQGSAFLYYWSGSATQ